MPTRDDVPGLPWHALPAAVAESCASQGCGPVVFDPAVLARVAVLFGGSVPQRAALRRLVTTPADGDPAGVEGACSGGAGSDHDLAHKRFDDGALSR